MSSSISNIAPHTVSWQVAGGVVSNGSQAVPPLRTDETHESPAAPHVSLGHGLHTAIVRQRFYPAQLRRLLSAELDALNAGASSYEELTAVVAGRQRHLTWAGWDRSWPRLYLPVEALVRLIIESVDGITQQTAQPRDSSAELTVRISQAAASTLTIAVESIIGSATQSFAGHSMRVGFGTAASPIYGNV